MHNDLANAQLNSNACIDYNETNVQHKRNRIRHWLWNFMQCIKNELKPWTKREYNVHLNCCRLNLLICVHPFFECKRWCHCAIEQVPAHSNRIAVLILRHKHLLNGIYGKWHIEQAMGAHCIGIGAVNKNKSMQEIIRRCISQMEYKMGNVSTMSELYQVLEWCWMHREQKHANPTGAAAQQAQ